MGKIRSRSLAVYLRTQARERLTPAERAGTEVFFSKLSDDQEFYRYLAARNLIMVHGAWKYKLRNSKTDFPGEVWGTQIERDKYGAATLGDGPDAKAILNHAVDVLVEHARDSVSPQKVLTIQSGGRSGMPNTGKVRKKGSNRDNRSHK